MIRKLCLRLLFVFAALFAVGGSAATATAQYYHHRPYHRRYNRPYRRPYHRPYYRRHYRRY